MSKPMGDNPAQSHCLQLASLQLQFVLTYMAYCFTLRVKAAVCCKTLVPFYQTTWYNILENHNLHIHSLKTISSHTLYFTIKA